MNVFNVFDCISNAITLEKANKLTTPRLLAFYKSTHAWYCYPVSRYYEDAVPQCDIDPPCVVCQYKNNIKQILNDRDNVVQHVIYREVGKCK